MTRPASKSEFTFETGTSKVTWHIDPDSSVAVYVQIQETIMAAIASGRFKQADKLPSIHDLAIGLNLNPNTVAKLYRELEVKGMLYTRRGSGVYIDSKTKVIARKHCAREIYSRGQDLARFAVEAGMEETLSRSISAGDES